MLNFLTVHWQSDQWIEVQLSYISRNVHQPYRVFASLNGITDPRHTSRFHFSADLEGNHGEKLNELARIASATCRPTDVLVFIDGDAFPIRPIDDWVAEVLRGHPLAAVRRDENLLDPQPHPSFCVTTAAFWNELGGDWRGGYSWVNAAGQRVTDIGATLLQQLSTRGIEWLPLLRTNTHNPHPLWFAVYEHRIYHHGAGFRRRVSRVDLARSPGVHGMTVGEGMRKALHDPSRLRAVKPHDVGALCRNSARRVRATVTRRAGDGTPDADDLDRALLRRLALDPSFYRDLDRLADQVVGG